MLHYRNLKEIAPKEHPYYAEADDFIKGRIPG